jgi:uncharacterized protein (TIGR00369 family)
MDAHGASDWTPVEIAEGVWAGWRIWSSDPYELLSGPFYARRDAQGRMRCAFRAERKHMNNSGAMHGGCLMTFADYALFCIASDDIESHGSVTAQMSCEFIDAALEGEIVEAHGEVIRAGRSLVFVRGMVEAAGRPVLSFSAIMKRAKPRPGF